MVRLVTLFGVLLAVAALAAKPARADFSACSAALAAKDPHQQIDLYTGCLKHGGLTSTDVAGAFNNRGVGYEQVGEPDKALEDFTSAIQYYPGWALPRANRAGIEASRGRCADAMADIEVALKLERGNKQMLAEKARLAANCPIESKPPS
jgi:tetratricopeptide (TPR) repeat protein